MHAPYNQNAIDFANIAAESFVNPQRSEPIDRSSTVGLSLVVDCIESIEDIFLARDEIDRLSNVPFLQTAWMVAWLESHQTQYDSIKFLLCRNQGQPIAFLPLVLCRSLPKGRHLVFVGNGKACADFMTIAGAEFASPSVTDAFADWLWDRRSEWDMIEFDGVPCNDPPMRSLVRRLNDQGCKSTDLPSLATWRTQLPETWQSFEAALSKNSRKKFRRLARGLDEAGASFRYADDEDSLIQGLSILKTLHTKRWVSLGEKGCFATPCFEDFVNRLAHAHMRQGTLRLVWLELDQQPIAVDIAFVSGRGLFTYQGGIDPEHLKWEPGRAILRCQVEHAIGEGLEFIDFLRGDEGYKTRWQAAESDTTRIQVSGTSWRSRATCIFLSAARKVKRILKKAVAGSNKR